MNLSIRHWNTILAALRVAAEQYSRDAAHTVETPRVAAQFRQQAEDASNLAAFIENHS